MKKIFFILLFLCACVGAFSQPNRDEIYKSRINSAYDYIRKGVDFQRDETKKWLLGGTIVLLMPVYPFKEDGIIDSMITMIDFKADSLNFEAAAVGDSGWFSFVSYMGIATEWCRLNMKYGTDQNLPRAWVGRGFTLKTLVRYNIVLGLTDCARNLFQNVIML